MNLQFFLMFYKIVEVSGLTMHGSECTSSARLLGLISISDK